MNPNPVSRRFLLGCMTIFLVNGALVLMTSSILSFLMLDYHLAYDQGGMLISIQSIGCLLANFLSGPISIRIGRKTTLVLAAVCFLAGYAGIALMPALPVLQVLLFITGLGWGAFNNLVNFLLNRATNGDSGKITLVHTSFSVGAFLAPMMVGLMTQRGISWRWPVGIVALGSLLLVFVILAMPVRESSRPADQRSAVNLGFLRQWRYYLYMLLLFSYCGAEVGCSSWLVTYLTTIREYGAAKAQSMLSLLWVSIIAGRVLVSIFGSRLKKAAFLMLEGIGALLGTLLLVSASQSPLLAAGIILTGLSLSAFYGMIIANASDLIIESSIASGLMMSFGGLGSTVIPFLIGSIAEKSSITAGIWFLAGLAAFMMIQTIINYLAHGNTESAT